MSNGNDNYTDKSDFALWDRYENVAMHFNDLIIRLRTQALGALAGVVAISGLAVNFAQKAESRTQWVILLGALIFFTFAWIALWVLDMCYYDKLLLGAVKAIEDHERVTQTVAGKTPIWLSTKISAAVPHHRCAIGTFYLLVFLVLLAGVGYSSWQVASWTGPKHDIPEYKIQLTYPEKLKSAEELPKPPAAP